MSLSLKDRIGAFAELGIQMGLVADALKTNRNTFSFGTTGNLLDKTTNAWKENPWFTPGNVCLSICSLSQMLQRDNLEKWLAAYPQISGISEKDEKTIGVVMAGNLPLVGFHDFLCLLISGHNFAGKLSSKDSELPMAVAEMLVEIEPKFNDKIGFSSELPPNCSAVIATGSDNAARYFEHAYGNVPHLFRKNRNSVAILTGQETNQELELLANDIFSYFGLGCRNVSKLYVPKGHEIKYLKKHWDRYSKLVDHKGYNNNLIYNKALMKVARIPFFDFGFCTLKYDFDLVSPISVINVEEYDSFDLCQKGLVTQENRLQCIVGNFQSNDFLVIPFGQSQSPLIWDYADGVDTMEFLIDCSN